MIGRHVAECTDPTCTGECMPDRSQPYRQVCLGCGGQLDSNHDCPHCDERAAMLIATSHWPLEVSLSPCALSEVRVAVTHHLNVADVGHGVDTELHNLCSNLRSHLQHVEYKLRARKRKAAEPKDPLLL